MNKWTAHLIHKSAQLSFKSYEGWIKVNCDLFQQISVRFQRLRLSEGIRGQMGRSLGVEFRFRNARNDVFRAEQEVVRHKMGTTLESFVSAYTEVDVKIGYHL